MKGNNIVLIGMMGAGKSTVGIELSTLLDFAFIDIDDELEKRTGVSIPIIFDVEGEDGFREREAKLIEEVTTFEKTVISTGGGAILAEQNRVNLQSAGTVVYLSATVELLYKRTRHSKNRPLLNNQDAKKTLSNLYSCRHNLYSQTADLTVESGNMTPKEMAVFIKQGIFGQD